MVGILFLVLLFQRVESNGLVPGGINVCLENRTVEEYVMQVSSYIGYQNYRTCCGFFCWKKCQKSRPVEMTYLKNVKIRRSKKIYECCNGWAPRNGHCTIPICKPHCQHGTCIQPNNCSCENGFQGTDCSKDIDECAIKPSKCGHICTNLPGSYICSCRKGFQKKIQSDPRNPTCKNVNECAVSKSLCQCSIPTSSCAATCHDTIGSYYCACSKGYKLSGKNLCVDENECVTNKHGCQHYCFNVKGNFHCGCRAGYNLNQTDGKSCIDINECSYANAGCEQICQNEDGAFSCLCRQGFKLSDDKRSCVDINECSTISPCDPTLGLCHNARGSFYCTCRQGYKLDAKGILCEDIDECLVGSYGCSHKCSNLIGSYHCICPIGFKLAWDQKTCEEINECQEKTHQCRHICTNTVGSYTCKCRAGFTLNPDGRTCSSKPCLPLPEISNGNLNCPSTSLGSTCSYTCQDGYRIHGDTQRKCLEAQSWSGKETICQPLSCPTPYPPMNGQLVRPCLEKFGSRCVIMCNHGYHLNGTGFLECSKDGSKTKWNLFENSCDAIELCNPNPCLNRGRCIMTSLTDYKCDCKDTGYIGPTCNRGLIQLPSFPTLNENSLSKDLVINAKPSNEIIIEPVAPDDSIVFHPNLLRVAYPNQEAYFKIESKSRSGRVRIDFNLSGKDAEDFYIPPSVVVRISARNHVTLNRLISKEMLLKQCYSQSLGTCPTGVEKKINFYSSCPWSSIRNTEGHISVGTDSFRLPFSAGGFSDQFLKTTNIFSPRSSVSKLSGKSYPQCSTSCKDHFNHTEHEFSIRNHHFVKAYLKQLFQLSPWWFQIMVNPSYKGFDLSNMQTVIYKGKFPDNVPSCSNLPIISRTGIFSVLAIKTPLDIQFMSSQFKSHGIGTTCIVFDVCRELYYVSFPSRQTIDGTESLRSVGFRNEHFSVSGLSLTQGGEPVYEKCSKLYKGRSLLERCIKGNVWVKTSVIKKREQIFNLTFDGEMVLEVADLQRFGVTRLDEARSVIGFGDIFFEFQFPLAGGKTTLRISDKTANIYKSMSGIIFSREMVITTNRSRNVRFVYSSSTVTFSPRQDGGSSSGDGEELFQLALNYSLSGGRVISVVNQAKIRTLYVYIYRSLDRIAHQLSSNGVQHVVTGFMNDLSRDIKSYTAKMMSHGYQAMLQNQIVFREKFVFLMELFEDLKLKLRKDLPADTFIARRVETLEKRLLVEDLIPVPVADPIKEALNGFQMNFEGGFCIQKLCFDACHIESYFTFTQARTHKIECKVNRDRLIRDDVKVVKGTVITADVSTQDSNVFEVRFPALFSFFHQNIKGTVFVNQTTALFQSPNFDITHNGAGFTFDILGRASITPLSTWESLTVLFNGASNGDNNKYVNLFQNKIIDFLNSNLETIRNQTQFYTALYSKSTKTMKDLEITKTQNYQKLLNLELAWKTDESNFKRSRARFFNARETFKSYQVTSFLRNFEQTLDNAVCKLNPCPETCLGTTICRVCQKPEIVNADILKCENVMRKVKVTQEEVFNDACNTAVDVYKTLYTGTCNTGGDLSALRGGLPDWGGGIGEMIGGTTGGVIGALTGVVVGQFFQKCTDTWDQYRVREIQRVPCKRSRFYTKEEEWTESKCNSFKKKVISEFGVPTSCNCTSHCVMTQEPSCLDNYKTCTNRRKLALKSMLLSANVYNETALEFMELEQEMELWNKRMATTKLEYIESQARHNQSLNDYNQAVKYTQMIHSNIEKLKNVGTINVCLRDSWVRIITKFPARPLTVESLSFGSISFLRKDLEINIEILFGNNIRSSILLFLNTYDIMTTFDSNLPELTGKLFCTSVSTHLFGSDLQYGQADLMCNRFLEMYEFAKYPIEALDKLETSIRGKRGQVELEITATIIKIASLPKASTTKASSLDKQAMEKRLNVLNEAVLRYSDENILRMWRNDMEMFASKTSVLSDRGIVDGLLDVGAELKQMVKYADTDQRLYLDNMRQIKDGYSLLYFEEGKIQNLQFAIRKQLKLVKETVQLTNFCSQYLSVSIDKPHRVDILYGDTVTFTCVVKPTTLNLKFTWYRNNAPLSWEHQAKLILQSSESGTYRCMVETASLRNVSSEIYINVESRPIIHGDGVSDVSILENEEKDEFVVFCNVSGSPEPSIKWRYRGFKRTAFVSLLNEREAVIKMTKKSARSGFYQCVAANKHGSTQGNIVRVNVLKTCVARLSFRLSFTVLRSAVTTILDKIFYSDDAKKAWSVSRTQQITLAITHHGHNSKVHFKLMDTVVNGKDSGCVYSDRSMISMVASSKTNMVQLLRNVLRTMSVKTNEKTSIAELREELRSTLLLEPSPDDFCPDGYTLHESQFKCVQCPVGTKENENRCTPCATGFYQPDEGQSACVKCPNQMTSPQGSVSREDCL